MDGSSLIGIPLNRVLRVLDGSAFRGGLDRERGAISMTLARGVDYKSLLRGEVRLCLCLYLCLCLCLLTLRILLEYAKRLDAVCRSPGNDRNALGMS